MSVGEGENRLRLCQYVEVEFRLADIPFLDPESWMFNHSRSSVPMIFIIIPFDVPHKGNARPFVKLAW